MKKTGDYIRINGDLSLANQAYLLIKRGILDLDFPPGSDLTEAHLAKELSMSRLPISMAIKQLEREGWLVSGYRKKSIVRDVCRQDIIDLFQLREMIELPAMCKIFDDQQTQEYSRLIRHGLVDIESFKNNSFLFEETETNLHLTIVKALNNQKINTIYEQVRSEFVRNGMLLIKYQNGNNDHFDKVISDWEQLEVALRNNNKEEALSVYKRDHLSYDLLLSLKYFESDFD